jgi:inner membrane protein
LTHSLFGVVLAESAYQIVKRRTKAPTSRRPFYYGSIIANNFPDTDLLARLIDPTPMSYLVQHRGYTHTLLWAIPQALLVFTMVQWWAKKQDKILLFGLCLLGLITHLLLDYQNSYGIHMFSPFDHHWMYGDTLFIVEPTLWIPVLALGFLTWSSRTINIVLFLCFLLVQAMGFHLGLTNLASFCILCALLAAAYLVMRELKPFTRPLLALFGMLAVIGIFRVNRSLADQAITKELAKNGVTSVIDLVLSPMPTHPTCWTFLAASLNGDNYRVDGGAYGHNCPLWTRVEFDLPKSPFVDSEDFRWLGLYSNSKQEIIKDYETDCRVKTFFQFARVPARDNNVLSDLRFGGNRSFSALFLNEKTDCPKYPTPWIPPRQDLLNAK